MEARSTGEHGAGAGWLAFAALVGALAGITLFPRKAHGALTPSEPRARPATPPG